MGVNKKRLKWRHFISINYIILITLNIYITVILKILKKDFKNIYKKKAKKKRIIRFINLWIK